MNKCSFCGRKENEVGLLLTGDDAHICDDCVERAHQIIQEELRSDKKAHFDQAALKKPAEIKAFLDDYVIGQDHAKKVLSVAVYNHYKRLLHRDRKEEVEIEKSNIILTGETGT
ncbi:MAG TPA: ClpX C4-type zinc finger protein, partial [Bacteroidales bacterium]|nr:ClpX C4-type zinc finger protein [Bacteroidales bacterium]